MDRSLIARPDAMNVGTAQGKNLEHIGRGNEVRLFANRPGAMELQLRHDNAKRVTYLTVGLELDELKALRGMIDLGILYIESKVMS